MCNPLPDIIDETRRLIPAAMNRQICLRLVGGLAIQFHSPRAAQFGLRRPTPDIDLVVKKEAARRLDGFLAEMGYDAHKSFNMLNGDRRRIYLDDPNQRRVDIFVGDFEMCHRLPLQGRLEIDPLTLPLAELFLTKAQIVQLNRKDLLDLLALLLDNPIDYCDQGAINADRIAELCAQDWGLYHTSQRSLDALEAFLEQDALSIGETDRQEVRAKIAALRATMQVAQKSRRWQARAMIGERLPWYNEVEEVAR